MSKVSDLSFRLEFKNRVVFEMRAAEMPSELLIGRSAACNWKVPPDCKSVSGSHVKLIRSGVHVLVRDLESRNGVYCDGKRISQQKMSVGDVYSIGECKLVVERDETPSAKEMEKFHVLEQLSGVEGISHRAMMGEYILYCQGKIIGGVYDDRFLVKPTPSAKRLLPEAPMELPYQGAKEMLLVDRMEDRDFLTELIEAMLPELPGPKPRKQGEKKE